MYERGALPRPLFVFIFKRAVSFFLPISHPSSKVITTRGSNISISIGSSGISTVHRGVVRQHIGRCNSCCIVIVQMYFLRRTNYIDTSLYIVCVCSADNRARPFRRRISKQHYKPPRRIINGCSKQTIYIYRSPFIVVS